jgi:lysophospholipase L1-like esterase
MKRLPFLIFSLCLLLPSAALATKNILVFGDSLSAGYGIARSACRHGPAQFLPRHSGRDPGCDRVDRRAHMCVDALEIDCWHRIDSQ